MSQHHAVFQILSVDGERHIPEKFIEKGVLDANSPEDPVLEGLGSRDG